MRGSEKKGRLCCMNQKILEKESKRKRAGKDESKLIWNGIKMSVLPCVEVKLFSFYQRKPSRKQETMFLLLFSVVEIISFQLLTYRFHIIVMGVLTSFLFCACFRTAWVSSFAFSLILTTIRSTLYRLLADVLLLCQWDISIMETSAMKIFLLAFYRLVLIITWWAHRNNTTHLFENCHGKNYRLAMLLLCGLAFFLIAYEWERVAFPKTSDYLIITDIASLLFFAWIVILNIQKRSEEESQMECLEAQKKHLGLLTLCHNNVMDFRQDFNCMMQDIGGFLKYHDYETLVSYYQTIMQEYNDVKQLSLLSSNVINEPAIYTLLCNKYYLAKSYHIDVEMEFQIDFSKLEIQMYDLARILGILLDNAIEAAKHCQEKRIGMHFYVERGEHILQISNTYDGETVNVEKIFEKGFSSKKKPTNHGLGLWEVKQILNQYDNLELYTHQKENVFCQELSIFHVDEGELE